jgi:O-antigen/teichoic acid export membrane protein
VPLILSAVAFVVSSYAINVWLGRHLGPADYGVLGVVTSLMSALNVMQVSGVPQAMSKFIAEDAEHADEILRAGVKFQLLLSGLLIAVFVGLSPLLAVLFHEPALVRYILLTAVVLPGYGLFTVYGGYYNGLHRFGRQARIAAAYAAAKFVLIILLAVKYGLAGALVGYALSPLFAAAVGFRRPKVSSQFDVGKLARLSLPLIGFAALSLLQYSVDLYSVKAVIHSKVSAGYYVAAQSVSVIPFLGLTALSQVLLPSVSRFLAADRRDEASAAVVGALRYLLLLLVPASALIAGSAPAVMRLLFGATYAPAAPVLRVLVVGYMAVTTFGLLGSVLNGAGRAKAAMGAAGVGLVATLGLCVWWVPAFGLVGAAAAMGTGAACTALGAIIVAKQIVALHLNWLSLLRIVGAGGVVLALAWVPVPPPALLLSWPVLAIVYGVLLVVTREITAAERRQVRHLLSGR